MSSPLSWRSRGEPIPLNRPLVMGILNVTPDSFSDGGKFLDMDAAIRQGLDLVQQGADILDLGGESTRPGSQRVDAAEQLRRVMPVLHELAKQVAVPISIDTMSAEVAHEAIQAGATIVNDVSGLRADPQMRRLVAETGVACIIMHMQGTPETMQQNPTYSDVLSELDEFFREQMELAETAGILREAIALDVGIGFGKSYEHNLTILANLDRFLHFGRPFCLGVSRKKFLGTVCGRPIGNREAASLAMACFALTQHAGHILRVHDAASTRDAVMVFHALQQYRKPENG